MTTELRDASRAPSGKRAELERKFATTVDQSLPWEKRGDDGVVK